MKSEIHEAKAFEIIRMTGNVITYEDKDNKNYWVSNGYFAFKTKSIEKIATIKNFEHNLLTPEFGIKITIDLANKAIDKYIDTKIGFLNNNNEERILKNSKNNFILINNEYAKIFEGCTFRASYPKKAPIYVFSDADELIGIIVVRTPWCNISEFLKDVAN